MPSIVWQFLNFRNYLSGTCPSIGVPMGILSDFNVHYVCYAQDGFACYGAKTFREALRIRKETGKYITRVLD